MVQASSQQPEADLSTDPEPISIPEPSRRAQLAVAAFLSICMVAAFLAYRLGLPGDFMFDDYPNLETLSAHGGVEDLTRLKLYLDDSFAGPTGRPVSMLSFLIDVRDWPADPAVVKLKNIFIHILNALVLVWLLISALRQSKAVARPEQVLWIAALATAWWLLHPLHVSTVLYAIQRMAELSTLFVLLGVAGYLYGRRKLPDKPRDAYLTMGLSLVGGTVLATLSKENGALLPLLAAVVELVLLSRDKERRPDWRFLAVFLGLPSVALVGYLVWTVLMAGGSVWVTRGFSPEQRLLTEGGVLLEYLSYLLFPRAQTSGIFRDTTVVSTSLFSPPATALAWLIIASAIAAALALRRRVPLLSAAVLFFFVGHLLESTVLPLELYFEHRNYLPSALLFLPVAQVVVWGWQAVPKPAVVIAVLVSVVLGSLLAARSEAWSDRTSLYVGWADASPDSPRAQLSAANVLQLSGHTEQAIRRLEEASKRNPRSLAMELYLIRFKSREGVVGQAEMRQLAEHTATAAFSNEALVGLRRLTEGALGHRAKGIAPRMLIPVWEGVLRNSAYNSHGGSVVLANHELGRLYARDGHRESAVRHFNHALVKSKTVETGMMQAAVLATYGFYCDALDQLAVAQGLLSTDPHARSNADYYGRELKRLESVMSQDAADAEQQCAGRY